MPANSLAGFRRAAPSWRAAPPPRTARHGRRARSEPAVRREAPDPQVRSTFTQGAKRLKDPTEGRGLEQPRGCPGWFQPSPKTAQDALQGRPVPVCGVGRYHPAGRAWRRCWMPSRRRGRALGGVAPSPVLSDHRPKPHRTRYKARLALTRYQHPNRPLREAWRGCWAPSRRRGGGWRVWAGALRTRTRGVGGSPRSPPSSTAAGRGEAVALPFAQRPGSGVCPGSSIDGLERERTGALSAGVAHALALLDR